MRVVMILVMAVISLTTYICVVLYQRKVKEEKETVLNAIYGLCPEDDEAEHYVERIKVLATCRFIKDRFIATINSLKRDGVVDYNSEYIWFTKYGYEFYLFQIKDNSTPIVKNKVE